MPEDIRAVKLAQLIGHEGDPFGPRRVGQCDHCRRPLEGLGRYHPRRGKRGLFICEACKAKTQGAKHMTLTEGTG